MVKNRYALCGVLALILPLAGCDQKAVHTPPPAPYAEPSVVQNPVIGADVLYSLVSPVALFPDSLLAQVLAASTAPDAVTTAYQWQREHSTLKGETLTLQLKMKDWPAAVKSLMTFPDVLAQMAMNIPWTRQLGDAYTRQPADVMNAVQTLRARPAERRPEIHTAATGAQHAIRCADQRREIGARPPTDHYDRTDPVRSGVCPGVSANRVRQSARYLLSRLCAAAGIQQCGHGGHRPHQFYGRGDGWCSHG